MDEEDYRKQRFDQKNKLRELVRQKNKGKSSHLIDDQEERGGKYDYNDHYGNENGRNRHSGYGKFEAKDNGFRQGTNSTHDMHSNPSSNSKLNHTVGKSNQNNNMNSAQAKKSLPLENSFGSFFGPSKRAIAPRILEEESERKEMQRREERERLIANRERMQKEAEHKRNEMQMNSKGRGMEIEKEKLKSRLPPPPPPKAQRVKEMRNYSFLLNPNGSAERDEYVNEPRKEMKSLHHSSLQKNNREGSHGPKSSNEPHGYPSSKPTPSSSFPSHSKSSSHSIPPTQSNRPHPSPSSSHSPHLKPIPNLAPRTTEPRHQPSSSKSIPSRMQSNIPSPSPASSLKRHVPSTQSPAQPPSRSAASSAEGFNNSIRQNSSTVTGKRPISAISPSSIDYAEKRRALSSSYPPHASSNTRFVSRDGLGEAMAKPNTSSGDAEKRRHGMLGSGAGSIAKTKPDASVRERERGTKPVSRVVAGQGEGRVGLGSKDVVLRERERMSGHPPSTKSSIAAARDVNGGRMQGNGNEKRVLSSITKPSAPFSSSKPPLSRPSAGQNQTKPSQNQNQVRNKPASTPLLPKQNLVRSKPANQVQTSQNQVRTRPASKPTTQKRPRPTDEESEDSFVVSEDEETTFRLTPSIINLFRRQHRENHIHEYEYEDEDEDDACMEVGWREQRREESRSSRLARLEDEREQILEEERERKKREKRKKVA